MKPSVHWRAGGYPLPSSAAARSGLGRGQRTRNRSVEQSAALRGVDRHAAVEMAAPPLEGEMVLLESGLHAAFESVHLPGSAAVAGESLRHPAACPTNRTAYPESELIRTGNDNYRRISGHEWGAIGLASCPPQQ